MRTTLCAVTLTSLILSSAAVAKPAAKPAEFQLNETSWTYVDPDKKVKAIESIDASGNYIENAVSGKHIDHGTAVMKDGKACFTSAMTNEGESCWTTHPTKIGHMMKTTNDKGKKLTVTRVAYKPMSMPK
jgi:hypothetical protein